MPKSRLRAVIAIPNPGLPKQECCIGTEPQGISPAVRAFLDALAPLMVRDILTEAERDKNTANEPHAMFRRTGSRC